MFYTLALCVYLWSQPIETLCTMASLFHADTRRLSELLVLIEVIMLLTDTCKNHTGGVSGVYELSVMCS